MKKIFEETSLEKCLESASKEFNVPKDNLTYNILEEKKSFFRKKVVVEIEVLEDFISEKEELKSEIREEKQEIKESDGTVTVRDGKLIIKNPSEKGEPAIIRGGKNVKVLLNDQEVQGEIEIFENSKIDVSFEKNEPCRELKIYISEDSLEAYGQVLYVPQIIYKLKDKEENKSLILEAEVVKKIYPPKYNVEELKRELSNNKVVYGIIEENLKECVENNNRILVAKGKDAINGRDDEIEIKFKTTGDLSNLKEDKVGNIDFKSIGAVDAVSKDYVIAVRHKGTKGENGIDITGKVLKCKSGKKLNLKAGHGCLLKDEDTVVSAMAGKPCIRNNIFYVYQLHEVKADVDISTGNIKFIGDITIHGNVKEGMEVECGNELIIEKDVERANIKAKGNINIKGNIVASKICGGGEDVKKIKTLKDLKDINESISNLVMAVDEIKMYNLLGQNKKDGEIIKLLLENKFKMIPRLCINVIADMNMQSDGYVEDELVTLIRTKLLGISPINIKHYSELNLILECIKNKISDLESGLTLPVNVNISYCQDSNIQSSGDIVISGKGEYISDITANGSIYFLQERSVARGGCLKSKNEIKCRVVGSVAGVSTKLQVEGHGHIWVDIAYHNTIFKVGPREYILDTPSKNVHAYLKDGDIVVDRLML